MFGSLLGWTKAQVLGAGPWGLFVLAFAESSFFPIPPDVLLILMALAVPEQAFWLAGVATLGSGSGACLGYALGRRAGRPILGRLISAKHIQVTQDYFRRYDAWAIGIAGFTPIPYKIFTIGAGMFGLRFWRFVLVSFLARGGRFFLVSAVLYAYGETARHFIEQHFNILSVLFVLLLLGGFYFVKRFVHTQQSGM